MIGVVGQLVMELFAWAEGCPCHTRQPSLDGNVFARQDRTFKEKTGANLAGCPLRGRRAPELAAGDLEDWLERLCDMASTRLLVMVRAQDLSDSDRSTLMADFLQARYHLVFTFRIKLGSWSSFPGLAFALGHHKPEVRKTAAQCIVSLEFTMDELRTFPTWARDMVTDGSCCNSELHEVAAGRTQIHLLPSLGVITAKLKLAPTVERHVEGLHASTHQDLLGSANAGPVHIQFHSVFPFLRKRLLECEGAFLPKFASLCSSVRNVVFAVEVLGLQRHPAVQQLLATQHGHRREAMRKSRHTLIDVIYHLDDATLFQDHLLSTDAPDSPDDPPGDASTCKALSCARTISHRSLPDAYWISAATDHWQQVEINRAEVVAYSLGPRLDKAPSEVCVPVPSLRSKDSAHSSSFDFECQPDRAVPTGNQKVDLGRSLAENQEAAWAIKQLTFFQVIKHRVGVPKTGKFGLDLKSRATESVVKLVDILGLEQAKEVETVYVSLEAAAAERKQPFLLSLFSLARTDLQTLRRWNAKISLDYLEAPALRAVPDALKGCVPTVVSELLRASALPTSHNHFVVPEGLCGATDFERLLAAFENLGIVRSSQIAKGDEDSATVWQITELGVECLRARVTLSGASFVFKIRPDIMPRDMTKLELMLTLEQKGLEFRPGKSRKDKSGTVLPAPYVAEDASTNKIVWLSEKSEPLHVYLLALATAHEHKRHVMHYMPSAYYECLLKGQDYRDTRARNPRFTFVNADRVTASSGSRPKRKTPPKTKSKSVSESSTLRGAEPRLASRAQDENDSSESHGGNPTETESAPSVISDSQDEAAVSAGLERPSVEPGSACAGSAPSASSGSGKRRPRVSQHDNFGDRLTDKTAMWNGFKFTRVFRQGTGQFNGWEVTCYNGSHSTDGVCRRTMTFKNADNMELVLRKLSWWCLCGASDACIDREAHKSIPYHGPENDVANLPSMEQLNNS